MEPGEPMFVPPNLRAQADKLIKEFGKDGDSIGEAIAALVVEGGVPINPRQRIAIGKAALMLIANAAAKSSWTAAKATLVIGDISREAVYTAEEIAAKGVVLPR